MRTTGILLAALLILAGCIRTVHDEHLESFSTGCARSDEVVDTRAGDANLPAETLHLKYSSSGLVVIQNNGHYNCYINGQWVLAEFDGKTATLIMSPRSFLHQGNNTLRVVLHDAAGNETVAEYNILAN